MFTIYSKQGSLQGYRGTKKQEPKKFADLRSSSLHNNDYLKGFVKSLGNYQILTSSITEEKKTVCLIFSSKEILKAEHMWTFPK